MLSRQNWPYPSLVAAVGLGLSVFCSARAEEGPKYADHSSKIPCYFAMLDDGDTPPPPPAEAGPRPPRGEGRPARDTDRKRNAIGSRDGGGPPRIGREGPRPDDPPEMRRPPLTHPLIRFIAPHNPELAGRLESLRRESPEQFERILAEALVRRLDEALDAEGVPPGEPLPPDALGGPRGRGKRPAPPEGGPDFGPPRGGFAPPPGGPETDPPPMDGPGAMRPPRGAGPDGPRMREGRPPHPFSRRTDSPELRAKREDAEQRHADATHRVEELVRAFRASGSNPSPDLAEELHAAVAEQFEARTALRLLEIEQHELELKFIQAAIDRMKSEVERRSSERDDILRRRMEALLSGGARD